MDTLLSFTVENFRSICQRKTISFLPTAIKDDPIGNIVTCENYRFLRTAAIYGANSSGKTNIVRAMSAMSRMILTSVSINDGDRLLYEPFILNDSNQDTPTRYEIDIVVDNIHYYYIYSFKDKKPVQLLDYNDLNDLYDWSISFTNNYGVIVKNNTINQTYKLDLSTKDKELFSITWTTCYCNECYSFTNIQIRNP